MSPALEISLSFKAGLGQRREAMLGVAVSFGVGRHVSYYGAAIIVAREVHLFVTYLIVRCVKFEPCNFIFPIVLC